MKTLIDNFPEVATAFFDMTKSIQKESIFSEKQNELILIGIFASHNYERGLRTHVKRAIDMGCSREEIYSSIVLGLPVVGVVNINASLDVAKEFINDYEKKEKNN